MRWLLIDFLGIAQFNWHSILHFYVWLSHHVLISWVWSFLPKMALWRLNRKVRLKCHFLYTHIHFIFISFFNFWIIWIFINFNICIIKLDIIFFVSRPGSWFLIILCPMVFRILAVLRCFVFTILLFYCHVRLAYFRRGTIIETLVFVNGWILFSIRLVFTHLRGFWYF